MRNQTDFVIPQVKSANHGLESVRFLGPKYGKAFQMISKIKNRLIVLKLPLRDGNLNHAHAVFAYLQNRLLVEIEVKQNEDELITWGLLAKFCSIVGQIWVD